jgi:hypothetical protein
MCALVGGPSVGKSNMLEAIWRLLGHAAPHPGAADRSVGATGPIHLAATLASGDEITLEANPPHGGRRTGPQVPVAFLPASARSGRLLAPDGSALTAGALRRYFDVGDRRSSAAPAQTLVSALERLCATGEQGIVLLIEEPELFLRPQAQRYLYRLLRRFVDNGNQVLYSTHAPAFLNVGRLEELALVAHDPESGTTMVQPEPLPTDESFRALSELDAERSELLLARAVLLVEGRTEKLSFPFIFRALGHDPDQEEIAIVECGGKPNMRIFIRVCQLAHIPFVAVHDHDAAAGRKPIRGERILNAQLAGLAGSVNVFELVPDFEAAAGVAGHGHKPARAWQRFSTIEQEDVPPPLREIVETVVARARGEGAARA